MLRAAKTHVAVARVAALAIATLASGSAPASGFPQEPDPRTLRARLLTEPIAIDGVLNEAAWGTAEATDAFTQTDPVEGGKPSARTEVKVLASPKALVIGKYQVTQTSPAGLLTGLPDFALGLGLTVRPAVTTGGGVPAPSASASGEFQPSLDITQRIGSNVLASLTVNTDFAETDVDTRRTNLTRFPLFFPEKRTFFLEGTDIFSFGLGLNQDVIPFFSRRVGLVSGVEVPLIAGGKVNGRIANTNVGGLVVGTNEKAGVVADEALMAVGRVKQNIWKESWVGAIATVGDPIGRPGSWLAGADFTYATSRFRGDKNLLIGVWGLATGRDTLGTDATSLGFKVDYPNDLWDIALTYKRIGRDFDPSLGFVPRRAVHLFNLGVNNRTRLARGPIQQLFHDQVIWTGAWNPTPLFTVEFSGERDIGRLASGRFTQTLVSTRLRVNVSPDLSVASYVQYDTNSDSVGMNTRLRWTFLPVADLFVVYNHNVRSLADRWQLESNRLLIKLQYAWRL